MKRRIISFLLVFVLLLSAVPAAFAASEEANTAARELYDLGLFTGTGVDENGNPIFDLDRAPTRHEAVTMLVRLLGKASEAENGTWEMPFTDVADWAKPYVGYAYAHGLTDGTSETTYSGNKNITASQYLTFVLRALGYSSNGDFQWDKAWELSDTINLTSGQYHAGTTVFNRSDVALISRDALSVYVKDGSCTLADRINNANSTEPVDPNKIEGVWISGNTAYEVILRDDGRFDLYSNNSYKNGTYTYDGRNLRLMSTVNVTTSGMVRNVEYTNETHTFMRNNDGTFTWSRENINDTIFRKVNSAVLEPQYKSTVEAILHEYETTGEVSIDSSEHAYLAAADFRDIRKQYPSATAQNAYVYAYRDLNGDLCVLIDVRYKIISNYSQLKLHVLNKGISTDDPVDYYNNLANRAYGASKLQYMKLANEVNGKHIQMLQAMKSILGGGSNTFSGCFVDAATLNK